MGLEYKFFKQEESFCVAACLQSVLHRRNLLLPTQKEISTLFLMQEKGVDLNLESLSNFLKRFNLSCQHHHPKRNIINPDVLVSEALSQNKDILASYAFDLCCAEREIGHTSLVTDFDNINFHLLDPQLGFTRREYYDLIRSMDFDSRCGFYIIG